MFDWIRKIIKKKKTKQNNVNRPQRWRYAPDGVTKINVDD